MENLKWTSASVFDDEPKEEISIEKIFYLQLIRVKHKSGNIFVYLDPLNSEVYDKNLNLINNTKLGLDVLEKIKSQKFNKANLSKIPQGILDKAYQIKEKEINKLTEEDYYGEN